MKKIVVIISIAINVLVVLAGVVAWSVKDQLFWGVVWAHAERQRTQFELLTTQEAEVVFYGDSLTESGLWDEHFPHLKIANRGISGDTTEDLINRFDQVVKLNPKKLFLMIGVNDINRGIESHVTKLNYKRLFDAIASKLPNTHVYIQSILPVNDNWIMADNLSINELNNELETLSGEYGYRYIGLRQNYIDSEGKLKANLTNDGIHLLGEGYTLWKATIATYVNE